MALVSKAREPVIERNSLARSDTGGAITLLDKQGLKIDGVSYTRDSAATGLDPGLLIALKNLVADV